MDVDQLRSDIREGKEGSPLILTFNVQQVAASACTPLAGAEGEIWHCDAAGAYSGVSDPGFNTTGQTWPRGTQVTDANGMATFTTIYPGWRQGRAVHIHFKIRPTTNSVFTSQLFFDDALSEQVFTQAPYAGKGQRNTFNSNDTIYNSLLLMTRTPERQGYVATFPIGVDLSTVGTPRPPACPSQVGRRAVARPERPPDQLADRRRFALIRLGGDARPGHVAGGARLDDQVAGRVRVKVVPWPGTLATATRPPCASTRDLTMASPRPDPPASAVRAASAR